MIRHQIYFDTLGSLREDSATWRCVFAGLSVLRLVDSYGDVSIAPKPAGWAQLHSVRAAIEEMSEGDPMRGVLTAVLEEVSTHNTVNDTVSRTLMAYGRALDSEASWSLATDVFATVAKLTKPERNARLAVEANVAIGGAARRNGDWDTSARAYSQAAYIADTLGDRVGVLTVQVGIANTYFAKGNLPQAQTILDDVIVQARDQHLGNIHGMALHSRAAISHLRGDYEQALKLAYEAFNLTSDTSERDLILSDIAAGFSALNMRDSARDALLIASATSQGKRARWQATINLLELAGMDEDEKNFDAYNAGLRKAPMGPWLRSHYLLILGEGLINFDRFEAAEAALKEAIDYASANQVHKVVFQAESALKTLASTVNSVRNATSKSVSFQPTQEVLEVARSITRLREAALAAC
jgi:tetratricopeptide (TPR) repeat protein